MGWHSCPFLITPGELKTAFEPFKLVISNAHVPIDYTDTPAEEFLENYSALYERLISGGVFEGTLRHIAVTSDLSRIKFGRVHEYEGKQFKSILHDKKSVMPYLAPFTFMTYMDNDKLIVSTRASYLVYSEAIFGYELNFPEFCRSDTEYWGGASEKELEGYDDYKLLRKKIIKITKPFCFDLNGIYKKTSIRISDEVRKYLPQLHCIKGEGINEVI